jgi:hypothetical protein
MSRQLLFPTRIKRGLRNTRQQLVKGIVGNVHGLTVPFALIAGVKWSWAQRHRITVSGLLEIGAGCISKGSAVIWPANCILFEVKFSLNVPGIPRDIF